jgi:hypothetical protein
MACYNGINLTKEETEKAEELSQSRNFTGRKNICVNGIYEDAVIQILQNKGKI